MYKERRQQRSPLSLPEDYARKLAPHLQRLEPIDAALLWEIHVEGKTPLQASATTGIPMAQLYRRVKRAKTVLLEKVGGTTKDIETTLAGGHDYAEGSAFSSLAQKLVAELPARQQRAAYWHFARLFSARETAQILAKQGGTRRPTTMKAAKRLQEKAKKEVAKALDGETDAALAMLSKTEHYPEDLEEPLPNELLEKCRKALSRHKNSDALFWHHVLGVRLKSIATRLGTEAWRMQELLADARTTLKAAGIPSHKLFDVLASPSAYPRKPRWDGSNQGSPTNSFFRRRFQKAGQARP